MSVEDRTKSLVTGDLLFKDSAEDTLKVVFMESRVLFNTSYIPCALRKDDIVVLHRKLTEWLSSQE